MSRSPSRLMVRNVTYGRPTQGGSKSGLNVTISSTRRLRTRSTTRPNTSRLVGSVQCASSKIISTGFCLVSASSGKRALPAFSVGAARRSRSSAGYRPSFGSDSISANSAASCFEVEVCASIASSLSSFACGVSSCTNPAARSIWLMIG